MGEELTLMGAPNLTGGGRKERKRRIEGPVNANLGVIAESRAFLRHKNYILDRIETDRKLALRIYELLVEGNLEGEKKKNRPRMTTFQLTSSV